MAPNATVALPSILPDSFLLAYTIPLLLLSIVAALCGAFLTLDRTRSFAPIETLPSLKDHREPSWRLEGGFGGVVAGWLCGQHLTTYLALLILNRTNLTLSGIQFMVIWILPGTLLAVIGGRWRVAASISYSLIGGAAFTALVTIIFIPQSLLPRFIIYIIFTLGFLIGTLLPLPNVRHWALRICGALTGAMGVVISIALFSHAPSWSSPWLLLAVSHIVGERNAQEKGLSTAVFLLMGTGISVDWVLKMKLGEDPDQAWDEYLARYSKELPLSSDRQGVFEPAKSYWSRLSAFFRRKDPYRKVPRPDLFPPDSEPLPHMSKPPGMSRPPPAFRPYPTKRQSTAATRTTLSKHTAKLDYSDNSSSDSSDDDAAGTPKFRPWLKKRQSSAANSTAPTVFSPGTDPLATPTLEKVEEYSDAEEQDVAASSTAHSSTGGAGRDSHGWKPAFLKKHYEDIERRESLKRLNSEDAAKSASTHPRFTSSPTPMSTVGTSTSSKVSSVDKPLIAPTASLGVPQGAVEVTPSLIRAFDRISQAQQEAAARATASASSRDDLARTTAERTITTPPRVEADLDEGFWARVKTKAAEYRPRRNEEV